MPGCSGAAARCTTAAPRAPRKTSSGCSGEYCRSRRCSLVQGGVTAMKTVARILAVLAALLALPAFANFHLWSMSELYSSADGSVQFLELRALTSGQQFVSGHSVSVSANGVTHTFGFESDLPGDTSGRTFLVGTQSF